jgi:GNAT superfamily N-acetyltransferase
MHVILKPRSEMARTEIEEFWNLEDIVYPNGFDGPAELKGVKWADPGWDICVRDDTRRLIAHAGILERDVLLDHEPARIAGIAEMLTHPEFRRRGYGAAALREAARFMRDELQTPFALLTCPHTAIPFYSALGWQRFNGSVIAEVEGGMGAFAESAWMVLPVTAGAPNDGVLDLQGIPW